MDIVATYQGLGRNLEGDLTITFAINDDPKLLEYIQELKDQELMIEISKVSKKHSDKARRYMWKLCDLMAKKLGTTKDVVYILALKDAGIFQYIEIPQNEIDKIRGYFRYIEEIGTHDLYQADFDGQYQTITISELRCYEGMHDYSSKELSDLIKQIVTKCEELSIPTITEAEFRRLAGL